MLEKTDPQKAAECVASFKPLADAAEKILNQPDAEFNKLECEAREALYRLYNLVEPRIALDAGHRIEDYLFALIARVRAAERERDAWEQAVKDCRPTTPLHLMNNQDLDRDDCCDDIESRQKALSIAAAGGNSNA